MLVFKSKHVDTSLAPAEQWSSHNTYFYFMPNPLPLELLKICCPDKVEKLEGVQIIQYAPKSWLLVKDYSPLDIAKPYQKGETIKLADGLDYIIPTIKDVRRKFILQKDTFEPIVEISDPLFDELISKVQKIKELTYKDILQLTISLLSRNYYINLQVAVALGLFDIDSLEKAILKVLAINDIEVNTDFFQEPSEILDSETPV